MKNLIFSILFLAFGAICSAQSTIDYGIKTGLNYNSNGDLLITGGFTGLNIADNESDFGYQFGIYTQFNFTKFYIRPELIYSKTKSTYNNILSVSDEFKISTLELPILVGYKVIKPVNIYVGPSLQYILNTGFSTSFDLELDKDFVAMFNLGVSVQLSKFEIDLRYSTGFSKNLAVYFGDIVFDGAGYSIDSKQKLISLSFSYQLN